MSWSVIYHKNCADGFASAWVASKALPPDTSFFPKFHNEELPKYLSHDVLICDFSYGRQTLLDLNHNHNIIVLDHHKSAKKELDGLSFCHFDMMRSGAMLTWNYFFPDDADDGAPWLVKYVQDMDLWAWKLPHSKAVSTFISTIPYTFEAWDNALEIGLDSAIEQGKAMLRYQDSLVNRIVKNNAYRVNLDGHTVWAVNSAFLQSDIGHELSRRGPFGVVFTQLSNCKWKVSLRVDDNVNFDVSELAKKYGGGGHEKAAGFVVDNLQGLFERV